MLIYLFIFILLAIKKRILKIAGYVESNETCLVQQNFRKYNTNVTFPKYIEAKCKQSSSQRKRSAAEVGILVITFTFTEEIPFNCNFDCLDRIGATLRFQFFEVQRRVASGLALSVANLETSELVNISLQGELQADNGDSQITCTSGQVLSQDQEFCSKWLQAKVHQQVTSWFMPTFYPLQALSGTHWRKGKMLISTFVYLFNWQDCLELCGIQHTWQVKYCDLFVFGVSRLIKPTMGRTLSLCLYAQAIFLLSTELAQYYSFHKSYEHVSVKSSL